MRPHQQVGFRFTGDARLPMSVPALCIHLTCRHVFCRSLILGSTKARGKVRGVSVLCRGIVAASLANPFTNSVLHACRQTGMIHLRWAATAVLATILVLGLANQAQADCAYQEIAYKTAVIHDACNCLPQASELCCTKCQTTVEDGLNTLAKLTEGCMGDEAYAAEVSEYRDQTTSRLSCRTTRHRSNLLCTMRPICHETR